MCVHYINVHVCGYVYICISVYLLFVYVYAYVGWVCLHFDTDKEIKVEGGLGEKDSRKGMESGEDLCIWSKYKI